MGARSTHCTYRAPALYPPLSHPQTALVISVGTSVNATGHPQPSALEEKAHPPTPLPAPGAIFIAPFLVPQMHIRSK